MKNETFRRWKKQGWDITKTGGGHLKLTHPKVVGPVFTGSTPSDIRALRNCEALLRRKLAEASQPEKACVR